MAEKEWIIDWFCEICGDCGCPSCNYRGFHIKILSGKEEDRIRIGMKPEGKTKEKEKKDKEIFTSKNIFCQPAELNKTMLSSLYSTIKKIKILSAKAQQNLCKYLKLRKVHLFGVVSRCGATRGQVLTNLHCLLIALYQYVINKLTFKWCQSSTKMS